MITKHGLIRISQSANLTIVPGIEITKSYLFDKFISLSLDEFVNDIHYNDDAICVGIAAEEVYANYNETKSCVISEHLLKITSMGALSKTEIETRIRENLCAVMVEDAARDKLIRDLCNFATMGDFTNRPSGNRFVSNVYHIAAMAYSHSKITSALIDLFPDNVNDLISKFIIYRIVNSHRGYLIIDEKYFTDDVFEHIAKNYFSTMINQFIARVQKYLNSIKVNLDHIKLTSEHAEELLAGVLLHFSEFDSPTKIHACTEIAFALNGFKNRPATIIIYHNVKDLLASIEINMFGKVRFADLMSKGDFELLTIQIFVSLMHNQDTELIPELIEECLKYECTKLFFSV